MELYVVFRDSADGEQVDLFDSYAMAKEWADCVGAEVYSECVIDRETLDAMKEAHGGTND